MPDFYYTDANGQKRGAFAPQQLKELAARGTITPNTLLETDTGHKGKAGQIKGLFPAAPPPVTQTVQPKASAPVASKNRRSHLLIGIAVAVVICVIGLATIGAFFSSSAKQVANDNPFENGGTGVVAHDNPFEDAVVERKADNPFDDPTLELRTDNPFLDGELRTPQITTQSSRSLESALAHFDERGVLQFILTDPLKTTDGRIVNTPELWYEVRRPELLKLFEEEMFGSLPADSLQANHSISAGQPFPYVNEIRHQHTLRFTRRVPGGSQDSVAFNVLIFTPKNVVGKIPAFIGLGFDEHDFGPLELILDRGYAVIRASREDIEPDFRGGGKLGLRKLIDQQGLPNEGNAIATWALGLSLMREHITAHADTLNIDPDRMAVFGFSRLGKTALWAAAQDTGFAMAISVNSGKGGASLSRREFGETMYHLNMQGGYHHFFNDNFMKYAHDVNSLPFDQHELLALIAPRPVYIASAVNDHHADPVGEFLSGLYADPVYRLLGTDGFAGVRTMPELNRSVGGTIGYHIREGDHGFLSYDWELILNFADKHFKHGNRNNNLKTDNPFAE